MIRQLLLTALVIVIVVLIVRWRRAPARQAPSAPRRGPSPQAIAGWALLGIMVIGATVTFYLQWSEAHEVVTIEVVDGRSGERTTYQVYRKEVGDRSFRTVDGREVSLGQSDRMVLTDR
ncbi:hypothetical protein [Sediminicurvatus halobius]|uniref:Antitermination protein NusG n=1 Tax=Sediminicurvatus halobius TaxID=2182432 RepID=A0A2U2N8K2_9GAMM|nr:hypothetical protein [Spiribacter halobius]PWG65460.1 hypothetical protein DEM34_01585 [Spiribacter halobius]UEX76481.1 hypothetical protein LMH63_10960 [Spiribacter halobius]